MTPHQTASYCLWGDAKRAETRSALIKAHDLSADQADEIISDVQQDIWQRFVAKNPNLKGEPQ